MLRQKSQEVFLKHVRIKVLLAVLLIEDFNSFILLKHGVVLKVNIIHCRIVALNIYILQQRFPCIATSYPTTQQRTHTSAYFLDKLREN